MKKSENTRAGGGTTWRPGRVRAASVLRILLVMLAWCVGRAEAATPPPPQTVQLNFKYTVAQGTCEVSLGGGTTANTVVIPAVALPPTLSNWVSWTDQGANTSKPFSINLSNCSGVGVPTTAPSVTITGNHDSVTMTGTGPKYVFRDGGTSSTSTGVGFTIKGDAVGGGAQCGTGLNTGSCEIADYKLQTDRAYIKIPGVGKGQAVNGNAVVPLAVGVVAAGGAIRTGTLSAAITFTFVYH